MESTSVNRARLEDAGVRILASSAHDLVVIKPAGMATELTTDPRWASLISKVRQAAGDGVRPRLVHRLDRATRGIVVVTLTKAAAAFYGEQIREGMWDKYYLARIARPDPGNNPLHRGLVGKHKAYLRDVGGRARIVRAGGKASFMQILALGDAPDHSGQSHVLIKLLTGRLHQIRVMMAGLGLPLIGDDYYGGAPGTMYLEHAALRYVDCATREMRIAFLRDDPDRERISKRVWAQLLAEQHTTG